MSRRKSSTISLVHFITCTFGKSVRSSVVCYNPWSVISNSQLKTDRGQDQLDDPGSICGVSSFLWTMVHSAVECVLPSPVSTGLVEGSKVTSSRKRGTRPRREDDGGGRARSKGSESRSVVLKRNVSTSIYSEMRILINSTSTE